MNLAQEKHGDDEHGGDDGSLIDLLGHEVRNEREDQSLLDPWTLGVLLLANFNIGDGFNSVHLILIYNFIYSAKDTCFSARVTHTRPSTKSSNVTMCVSSPSSD